MNKQNKETLKSVLKELKQDKRGHDCRLAYEDFYPVCMKQETSDKNKPSERILEIVNELIRPYVGREFTEVEVELLEEKIQQSKLELIDGLIEWAEKNKGKKYENTVYDLVINETLDDLIHHLKSLKI